MFGLGGLGLKIGILAILLSVIGGGYFYVQTLETKLQLAAEVQAKMEGVIEKQNLAMDNLKADVERMGKAQADLGQKILETTQSTQDLNKKFIQDAEGRERNLAAMANAQPNETEAKVNRGTKDALRCNEITTGSPLTKDEQSGKVQNNICPELLPKIETKKK
jgi:hypothetical protein